jgi:hypothetical protein
LRAPTTLTSCFGKCWIAAIHPIRGRTCWLPPRSRVRSAGSRKQHARADDGDRARRHLQSTFARRLRSIPPTRMAFSNRFVCHALWGGRFDLYRADVIVAIGSDPTVVAFPAQFRHLIEPYFSGTPFLRHRTEPTRVQLLDIHNAPGAGVRQFVWDDDVRSPTPFSSTKAPVRLLTILRSLFPALASCHGPTCKDHYFWMGMLSPCLGHRLINLNHIRMAASLTRAR